MAILMGFLGEFGQADDKPIPVLSRQSAEGGEMNEHILGRKQKVIDSGTLSDLLDRSPSRIGYMSLFAASALVGSIAAGVRSDDLTATVPARAESTSRLLDRLARSCGSKSELLSTGREYRSKAKRGGYNLVAELAGGSDNCPGSPIPAGTYTITAPYVDTGTTVGANNTVKEGRYIDYCYYAYTVDGPDQIYSFEIKGLGSNPSIEVSAQSPTYAPTIYVLDTNSRFSNSAGCPSNTGNTVCSLRILSDAPAGGTAVLPAYLLRFLPRDSKLHLVIDSKSATTNSAGPYKLTIRDIGIAPAPAPPRRTRYDFDGDGKADLAVFRPSDGRWWIAGSLGVMSATAFGLATDVPAVGDYDGDGKSDIAIFRNGQWWWINSGTGSVSVLNWGHAGDVPVPADYTGDRRDEIAVFRSGQWWIYDLATNQQQVVTFGAAGDKPVPGDHNGDGQADLVFYHNGTWGIRTLSGPDNWSTIWGQTTDIPVPADVNARGNASPTIYRNGAWWINDNYGRQKVEWGQPGDIPVPADYEGNGATDLTVYRNGQWWIRKLSGSTEVRAWGQPGDIPIAALSR